MKPDCVLIGEDGNIFNLVGVACRTLCRHGLDEQADEMRDRIMGGECGSYYDALGVIGEYVNITGPEESERLKHCNLSATAPKGAQNQAP